MFSGVFFFGLGAEYSSLLSRSYRCVLLRRLRAIDRYQEMPKASPFATIVHPDTGKVMGRDSAIGSLRIALVASTAAIVFLGHGGLGVAAPQPLPADAPADSKTEDKDAGETDGNGLLDLQIEQLRQVSLAPALEEVVSTVARHESTVGRSTAAVFVITPEMIRRSGAQTIPEA